MHRLPATLLACVALAAGAVAGCGDDDDSDTTSAPAAQPTPEAAATPEASSAAGDVVKVTMEDIQFVPKEITAKVDQKIEWENTDGQIPHTVTSSTDGVDFDSGNMPPGAKFDFTPTKAGTINYVCTIHSGQTGKITVTK